MEELIINLLRLVSPYSETTQPRQIILEDDSFNVKVTNVDSNASYDVSIRIGKASLTIAWMPVK